MDRQQAIDRMMKHIEIGRSHALLWGKAMDVMQEGAVEEMATWFVDQAFQAGLFEENGELHFLERTDRWSTQTGDVIYIQLAAQDELEAELQYLEMYAVPCVADYLKFKGDGRGATGDKAGFVESMKRMPLYCAIKDRLPH